MDCILCGVCTRLDLHLPPHSSFSFTIKENPVSGYSGYAEQTWIQSLHSPRGSLWPLSLRRVESSRSICGTGHRAYREYLPTHTVQLSPRSAAPYCFVLVASRYWHFLFLTGVSPNCFPLRHATYLFYSPYLSCNNQWVYSHCGSPPTTPASSPSKGPLSNGGNQRYS